MTREDFEKMLDAIQVTAGSIKYHEMEIAHMENEIRRNQRAIELDKTELASYREFVLASMFGEEKKEEPDPNVDPEVLPPVTDMEEVQKVVKSGGKSKRILMINMETGEEMELPSKTMAAQTLSITQLAVEGTKKPGDCKFTITEPSIIVSSVMEIHECTDEAVDIIKKVAEWKR